jgi:hypothetical protein
VQCSSRPFSNGFFIVFTNKVVSRPISNLPLILELTVVLLSSARSCEDPSCLLHINLDYMSYNIGGPMGLMYRYIGVVDISIPPTQLICRRS